MFLRRRLIRRERQRQQIFTAYITSQEKLNATAGELLDFLVEIANAAAISGDSEYLLAKRLNGILSSKRGEGKSLRALFIRLADFCSAGFITMLSRRYPELTAHERCICAMLIIGMDPGTICKVCGFEHEQTFYNKRKEIRRKLSIDHGVPLESYLKDEIRRLKHERDVRFGVLHM